MKIGNKLLKILMLSTLLTACGREEEVLSPGSNLDVTSPELVGLDLWIDENFTTPYNIEVVYRWRESLLAPERFLYPPLVDSVKPALEVVKKLWIDTYNQVADSTFVAGLAPRQLVLAGGVNRNPSGTSTLGLAEAGRRVVLFEIDLLQKSRTPINRFIKTIQHEYVHILNQTRPFDEQQYGKISPEGYTSAWFNERLTASRNIGFITPYSRSSETEDFAEMASEMLIRSNVEWETVVNGIATTEGQERIRSKERIVVDYYKNEFGIDFYELQDSTYRATMRLVN